MFVSVLIPRPIQIMGLRLGYDAFQGWIHRLKMGEVVHRVEITAHIVCIFLHFVFLHETKFMRQK